MNINDIFTRGLHKLDNASLLKLADNQRVLLNNASQTDLVYLVQELASRIEDLADTRASQIKEREFHGTEYNG